MSRCTGCAGWVAAEHNSTSQDSLQEDVDAADLGSSRRSALPAARQRMDKFMSELSNETAEGSGAQTSAFKTGGTAASAGSGASPGAVPAMGGGAAMLGAGGGSP